MTAQHITLTGEAHWAKVFEHNKDKHEAFHGPDGAYTVDMLLDKEELDKLTQAGSRLKPKITEEGVVIKFKRKHTHPAGISELGGPPRVVDSEGNPWEGGLIGNGSKVQIIVEVYDTKMGKGTRLEALKVVDLVEPPQRDEAEGQEAKPALPF